MDPDFRRDKPGKSPMGMELIPVYAPAGGGHDEGPGTIEVSPEVVNNLGVRTARVESRPLTTRIKTVGYVQYDEDRLIHIHPRVEGWIEKLYVKAAGDPVVHGQPLYELYSPQLVNAQEELLLSLKRNNSRLVQAAQDRLLALQLSDSFIDELKRERQVRQTITFRAPQSGVVDNLNIREGFFVKPGTTLMSIGALDDVWVEAEVFERQAALVAVGLPVIMTLNYLPGKEWRGTVDYVYPSLDEKTRTLRIRLRFNNAAGILKPNMFAQVLIEAGRGEDALMIPREAVIRTGSQDRVVLALGDGHFKSIAVRLGQLDEHYSQILEGLEEGDMIVVSAQFLLDSESSKSSDFMRMHRGDALESGMPDASPNGHHQHMGADHD
jgi:Cu(I)/Ag(I) efflux system membrane fusion protein